MANWCFLMLLLTALFCVGLQSSMENHPEEEVTPPEGNEVEVLTGVLEPCFRENHRILEDDWRKNHGNMLDYDEIVHCDSNLTEGWYRFSMEGRNAELPTRCQEIEVCQTHWPIWLDLQRQKLPRMFEEVEVRACASSVDDCCTWEAPIKVRTCPDFYIYYIHPLQVCNTAFCTDFSENVY